MSEWRTANVLLTAVIRGESLRALKPCRCVSLPIHRFPFPTLVLRDC